VRAHERGAFFEDFFYELQQTDERGANAAPASVAPRKESQHAYV